jgi:hypothetical protein
LIVLFGGTKRGQQRDVDRAKALFAEYKARKKALALAIDVGFRRLHFGRQSVGLDPKESMAAFWSTCNSRLEAALGRTPRENRSGRQRSLGRNNRQLDQDSKLTSRYVS